MKNPNAIGNIIGVITVVAAIAMGLFIVYAMADQVWRVLFGA